MKKFKIDLSFILIVLLIIFSPKQILLFKILLALFIHELGHLLFVFIFKVEIEELRLFATGLIMKIGNNNLDWWENIFLYSGGIIFNLLLFLANFDIELSKISLILLLVNLFPIYPLDGYQIINVLLDLIIPVFYCKYLLFIISLISIIISLFFCIYYKLDKYILCNILYLLFLSVDLFKKRKITYKSFLMHRYLYSYNRRYKTIRFKSNLDRYIYKYHSVIIKLDNKYVSEKTILDYYFGK